MTSSLSPQALVRDEKFVKTLEDGLVVRYMLFVNDIHGFQTSLQAFVFGYKKNGANQRQLFRFQTNLYANDSSCNTDFDLFGPEHGQDVLEKQFVGWKRQEPNHPWWGPLAKNTPFVGVLVHNISTVLILEKTSLSFSFFNGMLFERINAHASMLEDMARKDRSMSEKKEACLLLRRRFTGFTSEVLKTQTAQMIGSGITA